MNFSPADMLELEDQPERNNALRMFGALTSGVSASAVVVPIVLLLWFTALGRPGSNLKSAEGIVAEIRAAGKAGERTDAQLLSAAQASRKTQQMLATVFYRPLEFLLVTSAVVLAAWFAALYIKMDDRHFGGGDGSLLKPTLVGSAVGAAALWGLLIMLVHIPQAEHGGHGAHGGEHGAGAGRPVSLSAFLADNSALADVVCYLGGTAVASLAAAATARGAAGAASHGHGHHGHAVTAAAH